MVEFSTEPPWWRTDVYDIDDTQLTSLYDVATVYVNDNGSTQQGWGLHGPVDKNTGEVTEGFMPRFKRREFDQRKTDQRYKKHSMPFAYIMRSVPFICVDIDGKNGGFESAVLLGHLPPTLAETSKSGNGYHLFYMVDDTWDDELGYALFDDHIGIAQGIDIRATGCVYHYPTQRWNNRPVETVPSFLADRLRQKKQRRTAATEAAKAVKEMDDVDALVAHHALEEDLAKAIPAGKRNNTLFAIGSKMMEAGVPRWDEKILDRAVQVGLDGDEAEKLVANIARYGS